MTDLSIAHCWWLFSFGGVGFWCVTSSEEMTVTRSSSGCIRQLLICLQNEESSLKLNAGYINGEIGNYWLSTHFHHD